MTRDDLNSNYDIIYDHRNLILELKRLVIDIHGSRNDTTIYHTFYYYDEAGNRIHKMIYNNSNDSLLSDNIYPRDVSGRELAIYENGSIDQWNIYGMDNIGFIDGNEDIRFYMKDHLGSIRAVTDVSGNVVSSQDGACPRIVLAGDAWGYLLENRVYDSDVSVYKFTSKERDDESKYDYFGARYYDARVGRWGQVDPFLEMYYSTSPYCYTLDNPINYFDPNGLSTHTDRDGYVLAVYDDEDYGVYRHDVGGDYVGPFNGGELMGETEFWDEFIDPEGNASRIIFEESWDETIESMHEIAGYLNLITIAQLSRPNAPFDIKSNEYLAPAGAMTGKLLNGKYASARSAGNFLAGYNAASGSFFGQNIDWTTFMKLAGALHKGYYSYANAMGIVLYGNSYGPEPWYGEVPYAGRMIQMGWDKK